MTTTEYVGESCRGCGMTLRDCIRAFRGGAGRCCGECDAGGPLDAHSPGEVETPRLCTNCDHGTDPKTLTTCNVCEGTGIPVEVETPEAAVEARLAPDLEKLKASAYRAHEAVDERHYTQEALERQVKGDARSILDLVEYAEALERVAHAAWHLMDDSGESETTDDNGVSDYMHCGLDHTKLSDALDALEAAGWDAHPDNVAQGWTPPGTPDE